MIVRFEKNNLHGDGNVMNKVLLVTHQLSRTGAVGALFDLAILLKRYNFAIDVLSPKDGVMENEYVKAGITVIKQPDFNENEEVMATYLSKYKFIVLNTLTFAPFAEFLSGKNETIYWWIHENELHFQQIQEFLAGMSIGDNIRILSAGRYIQWLVKQYMRCDSEILNISIKDALGEKKQKDNAIRFMQVGLLDGMKGQEILVAAIMAMNQEYRNRCEFFVCGDRNNANSQVLGLVEAATRLFPCIHYMDSMPREQLYKFYDEMDCIVVPSRIESMSAVMIEGFMKEKICICTNSTGVSAYMENLKDGFVFETNNSGQLAEILNYIVENIDSLDEMRKNGRKIYEKNFSEKCFDESVQRLFGII